MAAFKALGVIMLVLYGLLLGVAIYNTYFFLIKQRRYRIYFISVFYSTAFVVILARIALAVIVLIVAFNFNDYVDDFSKRSKTLTIFLGIEIVATYAKITMGFF